MGSDAGTWYFFSASLNAGTIQAKNSCSCNSEACITVGQLNWDVIRGFFWPRLNFFLRETFKI